MLTGAWQGTDYEEPLAQDQRRSGRVVLAGEGKGKSLNYKEIITRLEKTG